MGDRTPAQVYALVIGSVLVIAGIIGFFYSASFGSPGNTDEVLGILSVNAWHNIVHIATGALGLIAVGYAARTYAGVVGVVYIAIAIWGFILGGNGNLLGFIPVNTEDSVLHLLIGVAGIGAYAATAPRRAAASTGAATA
jgi:Domain of unknown function (DUF4383)